MIAVDQTPWTRALVVFSGQTDLAWLRLLRPGYRHCFVVLGSPGGWVCINPLAHRTLVTVLPVAADFDVAEWYRGQGMSVVEAVVACPPHRPMPWRPFTCVEAVKRIIGLNDGIVLTPWQLFQKISKNSKIVLDVAALSRDTSSHQHHFCA
ncbi:conserved hypothetical protein [Candidatus Terasakiella magnetica]|nr:conserved hypothetical protein [Candidatus Terasakiella magnetica]